MDLFEEVLNECSVTWEDDQTNQRIKSIMEDGKAKFKKWFGLSEIPESGVEHMLYLKYCKYQYYDQYEQFRQNYRSEIIDLRMEYEVDEYGKEAKTKIS